MIAGVDQITGAVTVIGGVHEFHYGGGGAVQPLYQEMKVRMAAFSAPS
jgi:hypothetical protein|tara:strand:+ start:351 stop:494 length:144 start_codon:yes stop_codon:yes gene_type:complete